MATNTSTATKPAVSPSAPPATTTLPATSPKQPHVRARRSKASGKPATNTPKPVVVRAASLASEETPELWKRSTMIRHLRLAGAVRVVSDQLGTAIPVKKSELEAMVKAAPEDALFLPPHLEVAGDSQMLIVTFR